MAKHSDRFGRARNKSDLHQTPNPGLGPHRSNLSWHFCLNREKLSVRRFKTLFREKKLIIGRRELADTAILNLNTRFGTNRDTFFFFSRWKLWKWKYHDPANYYLDIHELWAKTKWAKYYNSTSISVEAPTQDQCVQSYLLQATHQIWCILREGFIEKKVGIFQFGARPSKKWQTNTLCRLLKVFYAKNIFWNFSQSYMNIWIRGSSDLLFITLSKH